MSKYQELTNDAIVEVFNEIMETKYFPETIKFQFTGVTKGKKIN